MADTADFTKLVPGFDFLQNLVKNAGSALPAIGQWVAPTLNPEEIEKRIEELRTVQFWLEQNARMLGATIQALEVQRMTLSTLKTMNVQMDDLRESMKIRVPDAAEPTEAAEAAPTPKPATAAKPAGRKNHKPAAGDAPPMVDPMQWWGALTKQFTELATTAMKDNPVGTKAQPVGPAVKSVAPTASAAKAASAAPRVARSSAAPATPVKAPARKRSGTKR